MDPIDYFYVAISVVYALVLLYMFVYNTRLKIRPGTLRKKGRPPYSKEEGIAITTEAREHPGVNMP